MKGHTISASPSGFTFFFKEHLINTELKQFFLYFSEMSVCKWRGRKSPLEFEQTSQLVDE